MFTAIRGQGKICACVLAVTLGFITNESTTAQTPAQGGQVDALADQVAELRARVDQLSSGGSGSGACYRAGWYSGVEAVYVKPYFEEGVAASPSYDFEVSPRVWLGYQTSSGLGWRVRYWQFDHDANPVVDPLDGLERHSLQAQVLDLDVTQFLSFGGFEMTASGGVRYARFKADSFDATNGTMNTDFEGIGPTLALDMRRPLGNRLSLIANGRTSVLFGDTRLQRADDPVFGAFTVTKDDDLVCSLETQVGFEYVLFGNGRRLALRALMEGQLWGMAFEQPDELGPATGDAGHDDMGGFFGFTLGLQYAW